MSLIHDPKLPSSFHIGRWRRGYNPDIIFATNRIAGCCNKIVMEPVPRSQHRPIGVQVNAAITVQAVPFRRRFNLKKANWEQYAYQLDAAVENIPATAECYDQFVNALRKVARKNIPRGIGVRANIHLGGQTEFCPNGFSGGGGSSRHFPGSIFSGGGGSSRNFPGSILCGVAGFFPLTAVTDPKFVFFPLTPVTDPKFVLFKHVLCFARIMSTLCPNSCRQTARIGGAAAPPCPPPVPYAYASWV